MMHDKQNVLNSFMCAFHEVSWEVEKIRVLSMLTSHYKDITGEHVESLTCCEGCQ